MKRRTMKGPSMDPNVVWECVNDATAPHADRCAAALELQLWIRDGGFLPDGQGDPRQVVQQCEAVRWARRHPDFQLYDSSIA